MTENREDKLPEVPSEPVVSAGESSDSRTEEQLLVPVVTALPVTGKTEKVKPPLTLEEKRKVWIRRIMGAILFFAILGSVALLAAAQAVTFLFKTILTP